MFDARYKELRIAPSLAATRELTKEGKDLYFVLKVLEEGYDSRRKRAKDTIEKWFDKGNKTFEVVIAKDYDEIAKEEVWVLIHLGKFTKRK